MFSKKKFLSLEQKVFILKSFYEYKDANLVRLVLSDKFLIRPSHSTIHQIVSNFETTGAVTQLYTYEEVEDVTNDTKQEELVIVKVKGQETVYNVFQLDEAMNDSLTEVANTVEIEEEVPSSDSSDDEEGELVIDIPEPGTEPEVKKVKPNERQKCKFCGKLYFERSLPGHYKAKHRGMRLFTCKFCSATFCDSLQYKEHKASHPDAFTCQICNKKLSNVGTFNRHMKIHKGQREHVCEQCGRAFQEATTLKLHMRIHTGENPHKCSYCSKVFKNSSSLIVHHRIHTGERPFKCEYCDKAFADTSTRNVHHRQHTGETPYACELCGKTCKQKQNLRSHMRHVHKMK